MTPKHKQLIERARLDAAKGIKPSADYMHAVNGKQPRIARAVGHARVLGVIERALYGDAS